MLLKHQLVTFAEVFFFQTGGVTPVLLNLFSQLGKTVSEVAEVFQPYFPWMSVDLTLKVYHMTMSVLDRV